MQSVKIKLKNLRQAIELCDDIKINTITGKESVTDTYAKYGSGVGITFTDGTYLKAAVNHKMWNGEEWIEAGDVVPGDIFQQQQVASVVDLPAQEWIDFSVDAEHESYNHKGVVHHNSGKSAIIYCYIRWMLQSGERVLLCVPTTMLVTQMFKDFEDYSSHNGWDVEQFAHTLHAGREKIFTKPVLISTWQSIHALTKTKNKATQEFMASWTVYIGDEAHRFASASLMQISDRLVNAKFRLGTTGTLKDSKVDKLTLEGSFGAVFKVTTTKDLMDAGQVVKLKIKCLMLQYPAEVKTAMRGIDYKAELDWLVTNPKRNRFIANLTRAIPGVTLVLFQLVEKQGKALYETIKKQCGDTRPVFYISGKVSPKEREEIRAALMSSPNAILVASYQTLSTGVNAPGIENVVFASPMKSRITNLQSIGRGLRLREGKSSCTLYDISDNLAHKSKLNHTLRHFKERIETYQSEGFEFNVTEVAL